MKILQPSFEIMDLPNGEDILAKIELAGRTAYRSLGKIDKGSSDREPSSHKFVRMLLKYGKEVDKSDPPHLSVIEHVSASVLFVTDRGISHEIVRHRLCSFTQESTRYVRYDGNTEGKELSFVEPSNLTEQSRMRWIGACQQAEEAYNDMLACGCAPEIARSVLPNCIATKIVVTANLREWGHIFNLRCSDKAHPDMRKIMIPTRNEFRKRVPYVFD